MTMFGSLERVPVESVRELFETMFFGPLTLIQAVLPDMRQRGSGLIVNISSATGQIARPMFAFDPSVKVALEAMSEGLSLEVARFGIRVVIIQPGNIATNFRPSMRRLGQDGPYETVAAGIERWCTKAQRTELKMELLSSHDARWMCWRLQILACVSRSAKTRSRA